MKTWIFTAVLLSGTILPAGAGIFITEINPNGSSSLYGADWFEITNTGPGSISTVGWKIDDNSNLFTSSVPFRGGVVIPSGASAVFVESNASGTNDATLIAGFKAAWFGANVPADFLIGAYGGSQVGLSASAGDAVNVFDATGLLLARVDFGAIVAGTTFDNAAQLNNATISQLSVAGTNGAFVSFNGAEIGSPGATSSAAPVPEPSGFALAVAGTFAMFGIRRRDCR